LIILNAYKDNVDVCILFVRLQHNIILQ